MAKNLSFKMLLWCVFLVFILVGCEDGTVPFSIKIDDYTTTMDTVTITFSEDITSITMPNTISFESGTFQFRVEDASENELTLGLLEWDEDTADTITLVVLGRNASTISGEYTFTIIEDNEVSPVELEVSEPISFIPWSGVAREIEFYKGNDVANTIWIFVNTPGTNDQLAGFNGTFFTVFDGDGNLVKIISSSTPSDNATVLQFAETVTTDYLWVRFFKDGAGYQPYSESKNVSSWW